MDLQPMQDEEMTEVVIHSVKTLDALSYHLHAQLEIGFAISCRYLDCIFVFCLKILYQLKASVIVQQFL